MSRISKKKFDYLSFDSSSVIGMAQGERPLLLEVLPTRKNETPSFNNNLYPLLACQSFHFKPNELASEGRGVKRCTVND